MILDQRILQHCMRQVNYFTFTYEDEIFPGQIVDVKHEDYVIKSMMKSDFHRMWPKDEDVLL